MIATSQHVVKMAWNFARFIWSGGLRYISNLEQVIMFHFLKLADTHSTQKPTQKWSGGSRNDSSCSKR